MSGMKINMDRANRILGWLLRWLVFIILTIWLLIYTFRNGNPKPFRNYDWLLLFVPLAALYDFGCIIYDVVFPVSDSVWNELEN